MQAQQQPSPLPLFSVQDHFDEVHPRPAHGVVVFWEQRKTSGGWKVIRSDSPLIPHFLADQQRQLDRYFTVNEFDHWRVMDQLKSLRACYVDIDGCTDLGEALEALVAAMLPLPSLAVFSGRGIHLYWLMEPVPRQALPVWQLVEEKLVASLLPIKADPVVKDCTRVLRLCGTINSKNGAEVIGRIVTGVRWKLHALADAVLGARTEMGSNE